MKEEQRIRSPHRAKPFWWYEHPYGIQICNVNGVGFIRYDILERALDRSRKHRNASTGSGKRKRSTNNKQSVPCPHKYIVKDNPVKGAKVCCKCGIQL